MTNYGVQPTGFVIKPLSEIVVETQNDVHSTIDPELDLDPQEPLGQLIGIFAEKVFSVWGLAEVAYDAFSRGNAEGVALDNIGALEGVTREGQSASSVFCTAVFTASGTYAASSLIAFVPSTPSVQWNNAAAIVVPTTYLGNPVSPTNPYPAVGVLFQSVAVGPSAALALIAANEAASIPHGSLSGMVPVSGWSSIGDTGNPTLGTLVETDAAYRVRQVQELSAPGSCTIDAIEAAILEALQGAPTPVVGASVEMYENTLITFQPITGLPPKSFMAVVFDGLSPNTAQDDPLIAQAIWNNKPAGIQSYGSVTATAIDSEGNSRTVQFSRSTQVQVYITVTVAIASTANPTAVATAVVQAMTAASQGQPYSANGTTITPSPDSAASFVPGKDVIANAFRSIAQGQAGVLDVPTMTLGTSPSPTGTSNIVMAPTQIAVLNTVTVTTVVFVP